MDDLKAKLAAQEKELGIKNEEANKLISVVGAETEKVSKEKVHMPIQLSRIKRLIEFSENR